MQRNINHCNLCGNSCNIDRNSKSGKCNVSSLKIARSGLHSFEEPVISGTRGSGTIFFCGCSLACVFCQNHPVSRNEIGTIITPSLLSDEFRRLENEGAHNINLVTPTHFVYEIIEALDIYRPKIPIVYNSHGFDSLDALKALNGYIDVYLPDFKYKSSQLSLKYSGVSNYYDVAIKAIKEMNKQVFFNLNKDGALKSGLLIRHLVLPSAYKDSIEVLKAIKGEVENPMVSILGQYTPMYEATQFSEINRKLFRAEYQKVVDYALENNIDGYMQELTSSGSEYVPIWGYNPKI